MFRISSTSSLPGTLAPAAPQLLDLPDEILANIISRIPAADNATLSHLVISCQHLWQLAGTDALLSFFHVACAAYANGNTEKKVTIFKTLSEWLPQVAGRLPDELRLQMLEQLVHVEPLQSDSYADNLGMVSAMNRLVGISRQETDHLLNICRDDPAVLKQIQAGLLRNDKIAFKGMTALSHYYERVASIIDQLAADARNAVRLSI